MIMRKFVFLPPEVFDSRLQRPQALAIEIAHLGHSVYFPIGNDDRSNPSFSDYGISHFCSDLQITDINKQMITLNSSLAKDLNQQDVIVVMHPSWQVDEDCKAHIHYDLMDRWWEFEGAEVDQCIFQNRYWLERADSVSVSSSSLLTDVEFRGDAKVVWNATFPNSKSLSSITERTRKIRFIYIGALSHWIDFDALYRVARFVDFFKGELVIVGQIEDSRICALLAYDSVHFMGELSHDAAMDLLHSATAGLIPFSKSNLTLAVDPIKVYEYLEHGLLVLGSKFESYNPSIQSKVSKISFWRISTIFLYSYLKLFFNKKENKSRLDDGNYWDQRACDFIEAIGSQ